MARTLKTASVDAFSAIALVSVREEVESYESFVIQERWPDSEGPPMWTNENRARYDRSHLRYPSDLTDDEWALVEPLIPPGRRGGDKRTVIMREVVNGLMYILSTGCQWRAVAKIMARVNVEIVKRSDHAKGFVVLPKRWVVERTFAWLGRCRRLAKDWENLNRKALAFLRLASVMISAPEKSAEPTGTFLSV